MENTSSGTNDAITSALENYADMVRRICFIYLKNGTDTQDVFQDVFLKLFLHEGPFENEEHKKAWLCRVTINQCKDFHKRFFRKNVESIEDLEIPIQDKLESDLLREVLSLPQKYKNVLYLFYYEEYTVPEIAKILNRKENTVYSHLHRAKALLKERLRGYNDGNTF